MSDLFYQYDAKLLKFVRRGSSRLSRIRHWMGILSGPINTDYTLMLHRCHVLPGQVSFQNYKITAETLSMMEVVHAQKRRAGNGAAQLPRPGELAWVGRQ